MTVFSQISELGAILNMEQPAQEHVRGSERLGILVLWFARAECYVFSVILI